MVEKVLPPFGKLRENVSYLEKSRAISFIDVII
jgi:hypothetical protein